MTQARDLADGKFDTDTLVVDAANNHVGVGTASPSLPLHVNGASAGDGLVYSRSGTEYFRIDDTGTDMNIKTTGGGHQIIFTTNSSEVGRWRNGGGLTFNGDTAAANALDDYEEGDFTPAIWEGTSAISDAAYNTSFTKGTYIKIGRMVMITMSLRLTSKGTPTGSSNFRIGGFPFTTTNDVKARSSFATYDHDATGIDTTGDTTGTLHAFISNGVNYLGFRVSDPSKAAAETLNYDDLGNDTYLQLTGTIVVD